jgi:cytochrome c2
MRTLTTRFPFRRRRQKARPPPLPHRYGGGVGCLLVLGLTALLSGCDEDQAERTTYPAFRGDPGVGVQLIEVFGCGSCHLIPGIDDADGFVGPPLKGIGRRIYIAGILRNTPENMMLWIMFPQRVVPGNAMPDMGINAPQARDIAAYLYTLQDPD